MTRPDLSRLHILNRELEVDQERLASLKDAAQRVTPQLTGVPGGGGDGDKVGRLVGEITDLEREIAAKLVLIQEERRRICGYIVTIEDPELRQVLYLRYVSGLSWREMAAALGGEESKYRKKHRNFMEIQKGP